MFVVDRSLIRWRTFFYWQEVVGNIGDNHKFFNDEICVAKIRFIFVTDLVFASDDLPCHH